jgi:hypothetical protein
LGLIDYCRQSCFKKKEFFCILLKAITKCLVLNQWNEVFREDLKPFENIDTNEIRFYGEKGKKVLEIWKKSKNSIDLYENASKFFIV